MYQTPFQRRCSPRRCVFFATETDAGPAADVGQGRLERSSGLPIRMWFYPIEMIYPKMDKFVEMCFDLASPMNERL